MYKRVIFITLFFFFVGLNYLSANVFYFSEAGFGVSLINSNGLNKITEGLNAGYGTSLSKIRDPLNFSGVIGVGFGRSKLGVEGVYEFASKSSYSSIYDVTEALGYSMETVGAKYQYEFFRSDRWSIFSSCSVGILFSSLSLSTDPYVVEAAPYTMSGTGFSISPAVDFLYKATRRFGVVTSLSFRYAATGSFSYSDTTNRHSAGDNVVFADGTGLTLNVSGLKFLVGITFNWS